MTFVYITYAPEDAAFVTRLCQDLQKQAIPFWEASAQAPDDAVLENLQRATHLIAVVSPHLTQHEQPLAAMEFARQNKLERLALRVKKVEQMPPQLQGVLPLDCSTDEAYQDALDTLIEDLRVTVEVKPELPEETLTALYSDDPDLRRNAIQAFALYRLRDKDDPLRDLAKEELNALLFRERENSLKPLLHTSVQLFDIDERPPNNEVAIPSKEDLALRAEAEGVPLVFEVAPTPLPAHQTVYFWQTPRWHPILGGLALLIGLILAVVGGQALFILPPLILGLVLPQFNVLLRKDGAFEWQTGGAIMGNLLLSLIISAIMAAVLRLILDDVTWAWVGVLCLVGALFGAFVGWLSTIRSEVSA